jgi:hypothetical protein
MTRNEKADLRGAGSKKKHLTGTSKRFFNSDYKHFAGAGQCKHCGSAYLRFAVNGYCQGCQQRVEFIVRESRGLVANDKSKAKCERTGVVR